MRTHEDALAELRAHPKVVKVEVEDKIYVICNSFYSRSLDTPHSKNSRVFLQKVTPIRYKYLYIYTTELKTYNPARTKRGTLGRFKIKLVIRGFKSYSGTAYFLNLDNPKSHLATDRLPNTLEYSTCLGSYLSTAKGFIDQREYLGALETYLRLIERGTNTKAQNPWLYIDTEVKVDGKWVKESELEESSQEV